MQPIHMAGIVLLLAFSAGLHRLRLRPRHESGKAGFHETSQALQTTASAGCDAQHRFRQSLVVTDSSPSQERALNTIAGFLRPADILLAMDVSSKPELFEAIGWHMEREHGLAHAWVEASLARREQVGSTGLGQGVAIPHARVKELDRIQLAYVRLQSPMPFDALDGKPVSDILVLLVPKQATEDHLRILSEATQMFSNRPFRDKLQSCEHAVEIKRLFDAWPILS